MKSDHCIPSNIQVDSSDEALSRECILKLYKNKCAHLQRLIKATSSGKMKWAGPYDRSNGERVYASYTKKGHSFMLVLGDPKSLFIFSLYWSNQTSDGPYAFTPEGPCYYHQKETRMDRLMWILVETISKQALSIKENTI